MPLSPPSSHAQFPIDLRLPEGNEATLTGAAEAIRKEFRNSTRWKKLRCRKVVRLPHAGEGAIFVLELGRSVEFDWTWEGATAFRPASVEGFRGDIDLDDFLQAGDSDEKAAGQNIVWYGEIVEVDDTNGRIFVWVEDPARAPRQGYFFVRPFEFLAFLHAIYCEAGLEGLRELLPARLRATKGDVHPRLTHSSASCSPPFEKLWQHSWSVLWGPPGCGKTFAIGQQVTACLNDPSERILVVSTTNKATDEVACSIGKAARDASLLEDGRILRIGKSADYHRYQREGLGILLRGTETEILLKLGELQDRLAKAPSHEDKATLRQQAQALRRRMKDNAFNIFTSPNTRVVVATAFKATVLVNHPEITGKVEGGQAPFTTVIVDEAGLISRAATAVLSLLASRRVLIVGDSKQLAPISKISRILPTHEKEWLASSAVSHLQSLDQSDCPGVHLLREQYRMHAHVNAAVSAYQYENKLVSAPSVLARQFAMPSLLAEHPRSLWYVLDEHADELPAIRAKRGPGNKSWVRPVTRQILKSFFSDADVRQTKGLFLSPFRAQARDIASFFAEEDIPSWTAATIHSQQGTEADFVIFDTVYAGSCGWPYDDWKRLVNVGLSRAREFIMLLASRAEMQEPYLETLLEDLSPGRLVKAGRKMSWESVPIKHEFTPSDDIASNPEKLGFQIRKRKELRPVMSQEQERLCQLEMDGKPRLVRGVAGSGKTYVLANWLTKMIRALQEKPGVTFRVVYANQSLRGLLTDMLKDAWKSQAGELLFPWHRVELCHIRDLLGVLLSQVRLSLQSFGDGFDFDAAAKAYLALRPAESIQPSCDAVFIDEAQDMGPNTLALITALVRHSDPTDSKSRSVNIFYDNAQNIHGRATPRWSEMGLDMRGRSTIMRESFRSTKPISEFALNVLYRLQPPDKDEDHKELVDKGLIEKVTRNGQDWWDVRFNHVNGPIPDFKMIPGVEREIDLLGDQIVRWIRDEGVRPRDISVLYNGKNIAWRLEQQVAPKLTAIGAKLLVQTSQSFDKDDGTVIASTSNSFKGYDSEIIVIAGADQFIAKERGVLANNLYVAMTRARSMLSIFANLGAKQKEGSGQILAVLEQCLNQMVEPPKVEKEISRIDEFEDLLERVGVEHRAWLENVWHDCQVEQDMLLSSDGEYLAEPLFWYRKDGKTFACFGNDPPGAFYRQKLEDAKVYTISPPES